MSDETTPGNVRLNDGLGHLPERKGFDKYAFLLDFDITRSTCGGRAGRYASEVTQRAYMVWADQQREMKRMRDALDEISTSDLTTKGFQMLARIGLGPNVMVSGCAADRST